MSGPLEPASGKCKCKADSGCSFRAGERSFSANLGRAMTAVVTPQGMHKGADAVPLKPDTLRASTQGFSVSPAGLTKQIITGMEVK